MGKVLLQEKKINDIAQRKVIAALREILSDPDRGLLLQTRFVRRMKKSIRYKETGRVKSLKKVLARYSS